MEHRKKNVYAEGKHIYLRHPNKSDLEGRWYEWFSDPKITKYLDSRYWPNSREMQTAYFDSLQNDRSKLVLSIIESNENKHIGIVSLSNINWVHRNADIGIVIGEEDYSKGIYATEAYSLILKAAFHRLNLLNIKAGHRKSNKNSEAILKLFQFEVGGVLKNMEQTDGIYEDVIVSYLSREKWSKRNNS